MPREMTVKLYQVDTIVAGRFNPAIITPAWLIKEKVVPKPKEFQEEIKVSIPDARVSLQYRVGDFLWRISGSTLAIETETSRNTAALAADVLDCLRHTPVSAIGNNFRFRCPESDFKDRLPQVGQLSAKDLEEHGSVKDVTWKGTLQRDKTLTLKVQINHTPSTSEIILSFNYHREISDYKGVAEAAKRFDSDLQDSRGFLDFLVSTKGRS